jgi:hypothetical protein
MNQTPNLWPIVATVTSLVTMIIGALLARWITGVVQNLKSDIRIAILEAEQRNVEKFASKDYVDQQVGLVNRITAGFSKIEHLLRARGDREAIVR